MKLYDNWKTILTKAWSMRFMALSAVAGGVALVLCLLPSYITLTVTHMLLLAGATVIFNLLAMWSRLVAQKSVDSVGPK